VNSPASTTRRIATHVSVGIVSQAITMVVALWSVPELLRLLGPSGYGVTALASVLVGYFSVTDLGLSVATTQRLARARADDDTAGFATTMATSCALLGGMAVLTGIVLLLLAHPIASALAGDGATPSQRESVELATRICAFGAVPALLRPVFDAVLASSERLVGFYVVSTIANVGRTVGAVILTRLRPEPSTAVVVLVLSTVLQLVLTIPLAVAAAPKLRLADFRPSMKELRDLLAISIPLWLTIATSLITGQLDRIIVTTQLGLATLGFYSIATELATRVWILPNITARAFYARLVNALANAPPASHRRIIRTFNLVTTTAALVVAVPATVYAGSLLSAWTGRADLGNAPLIMTVLVWGVTANVSSQAPHTVLQLRLHLKFLAIVQLIFLGTHAIAAYAMTKALGSIGAALSWTIGHVVLTLSLHLACRRLYGLRMMTDLLRLAAGTVAALLTGALVLRLYPPALNLTLGIVYRLVPLAIPMLVVATVTSAVLVGVAIPRANLVPLLREIRAKL
jgi:O-antigen/teichoic acid export membrane protein